MGIFYGAILSNFFNVTAFQVWELLQGSQLSHAVKGRYGGVCWQLHKVEGCGSGWAEAKKYKSREGNW